MEAGATYCMCHISGHDKGEKTFDREDEKKESE